MGESAALIASSPGHGDTASLQCPAHPARLANLGVGLMMASGFAGLGCQIVWTQQSAVWLGHESAAVLAVVAAFFGGLALGAWLLGERVARSTRPARWYAACEAVIGLWGLLLTGLIGRAGGWLLAVTGPQPAPAWQWAVAFGGTFVLLLPATAAMGATLPAMERLLAGPPRARSVAVLYAANTLGAVLGVLGTAFWLVPRFGLLRTAAFCALLNLGCAVAALRLAEAAPVAAARPPKRLPRALAATLAATGLLGVGYEVLVVRVLSQVAENTVFTFAILLAVYLAGTALGAKACERWPDGLSSDAPGANDALRDRLLRLLALACLLGTAGLWAAEQVKASALRALGGRMAVALAAETLLAVLAFAAPTLLMGALFSHLATRARGQGAGLGAVLAVNTLGAAAAPLLFGVLLLPALGPGPALLLVAAGYLALSARSWQGSPGSRRAGIATGAALVVVLALALSAPPLAFVSVPEGGRIVSYRDGAMAAVSVVRDADGTARLRIDNRQQEGSSGTRLADGRQAMLPLLLHPAPRRALFLGLGTGITAATAARQPALQVDAVELLPEVIAASAHFVDPAATPRLHVVAADARRFVRAETQRYDVIVADNFHPARSGSGALYTVEHFRAVAGRLAPGGLFCQWLPLHQLDLRTLRSIVRSFLAVHPGGFAMLATNGLDTPVLGLLARQDGDRFDVAPLRRGLAGSGDAAAFGIDDDLALLGGFVAGPRALARFAGDAPLNTDDRPVVAYLAPRITYAPDSLPRDRLLALLHELQLQPQELLQDAPDAGWHAKLAAYWRARDRFIDAGRSVQPSADVYRMLSQVREPLLAVLRISPQFRPASEPLMRMAEALAASDPAAARALLDELKRLQVPPP